MKNLLLLIFISVSFAACKSDPAKDSQRDIQLLPDAGAYTNNILTDTNSVAEAAPVREKVNEKPPVKTIVRTIVIERPAPQTGNVRKAVKRDDPVQDTEAQEPVSTSPATTPSTQNTGVSNDSSTSPSETASAKNDEEVQKKGMSKAAQGAIIGGVAGAVGGAVISKKKGLGAVVGGIAGAAGGYIIGKKMDKKDNRFMIE
jgi:hypothetical protein